MRARWSFVPDALKRLVPAAFVESPRRAPQAIGVVAQLREQAPEAWSAGDFARALEIYRTLGTLEPHEPMHGLRTGDCLARLGRRPLAAVAYRRAAQEFAARARVAQARSACRLVLRLQPGDPVARALLDRLDARREPPTRDDVGAIPLETDAGFATMDPTPARTATNATQPPRPEPASTSSPAPARAVIPAAPDERRASLGLVPLGEGEELVDEDDFDPATGHTGTGSALVLDARPEQEDEELWLDITGPMEAPGAWRGLPGGSSSGPH